MKLCKDCKYCVPDSYYTPRILWFKPKTSYNGWKFSKCAHPKTQETDVPYHLVVGGQKKPTESCAIVRKYHCGLDAEWFEAR